MLFDRDLERLVCARCARPVAQGRCPACRSAREQLRRQRPPLGPEAMIALAVALVLAVLVTVLLAVSQG